MMLLNKVYYFAIYWQTTLKIEKKVLLNVFLPSLFNNLCFNLASLNEQNDCKKLSPLAIMILKIISKNESTANTIWSGVIHYTFITTWQHSRMCMIYAFKACAIKSPW